MNDMLIQQAKRLGVPLRDQAGLVLVPLKFCPIMLNIFEKAGILVLGMDGFTIIGSQIVPEMDMIADYSELARLDWDQACHESLASARAFFDDIPENESLVFSFELRAPLKTTTPDSPSSTPRG